MNTNEVINKQDAINAIREIRTYNCRSTNEIEVADKCITAIMALHENIDVNEELKRLSKRVENIEKQMQEDRDEQLKKLEAADIDYMKWCCALNKIGTN